ncbi:MAG TPA: N-acetylmuramoyl-L-alanine amidase [Chthoniobacterales bacterium]|jgi:N-acetylmuramoyl-L-alanine amidase|nr:N-acetylmuramoyl-L-alanine amidase [Chthoniobacterales bacterium]
MGVFIVSRMRYNPSTLNFRVLLRLLLLLALTGSSLAEKLSPLATRPDWSNLDKYQQTITREDFQYLLDGVYAPYGAWKPFIKVGETSAEIQTGTTPYVLQFAATADSSRPTPRFWRQKSQLAARRGNQPLAGLRIALDPGHLGGKWAQMEERWFRIGNSDPVAEGDMTLRVAKLLVPRLEALGARVWLTRSKPGPVTSVRPDRLDKAAVTSLADQQEAATAEAIKHETERLFYRVSEIRKRAQFVNDAIKPDLVLCLHFNAEAWGDETHPTLTDKNHMHLLITGCMGVKELAYDDVRFTMLEKLLGRSYREELAVSESVAAAMAKATGLPPYQYTNNNALKIGSSPYVWARNLAANRLFQCPVVYIEPYVMNSHAVFDRVQAGDYDGKKYVGGKMQKSIYREYADGIIDGLVDYYSKNP